MGNLPPFWENPGFNVNKHVSPCVEDNLKILCMYIYIYTGSVWKNFKDEKNTLSNSALNSAFIFCYTCVWEQRYLQLVKTTLL